jgi:hypothetical protein
MLFQTAPRKSSELSSVEPMDKPYARKTYTRKIDTRFPW